MYFENSPVTSTNFSSKSCTTKGSLKASKKRQTPPHQSFSTLNKALFLLNKYKKSACKFIHQADWVSAQLSDNCDYSDYHNCHKLGFNPQTNTWHNEALQNLTLKQLPKVVAPGVFLSLNKNPLFNKSTLLISGTTDSNAAFIASGINQFGQAITSLGTTLVLKTYSPIRIESAKHGIYSHKYKNGWIVSGASNCGTGILKQFFNHEEILALSTQLLPNTPTGLNYYPLTKQGERFPIADPNKTAKLTPQPKSQLVFFQAILQNIAKIEVQGYQLFHQLGAPYPSHIFSAGGGAVNSKWQQIRQQHCKVSISKASNTNASFGTALLALSGYNATL